VPVRLARPGPTAALLWTAACAVAVGTAWLIDARASGPAAAFQIAAVGAAAIAAIVLLPHVEPAVPICAGLAASMFSGKWDQLSIPFGLDRPLLLYGVAAVALSTLPDARERRRLRPHGLHWLLAAVALYAIGSALLAGTLTEREPLFALLDKFGLVGFLLFAVAPVAFATERQRRMLLGTLVAIGTYLGLTALAEQLDATALVFPRYINDPHVGIHYGRARGPFAEAGANGLVLYSCLVAAAIAAAGARRSGVRGLCLGVAALCGVGLLLTLTRQIWLAAVVSTALTLAAAAPLRRWLVPVAAIGLIGVLGAFALVPGLRDVADQRASEQRPVWDRLNSDRAALAMVDARPLAGFGWYRFQTASPPYYQQAATYPLTTVAQPHNVFLGYLAELGLLGTAAWALALAIAVLRPLAGRAPPALEPWRIGLLAIGVNWLVVANFTPLGYALPNHLLWLWAGIVWARFAPRTATYA
jgi:putative inorganic carbon (hco3(-)) transporter